VKNKTGRTQSCAGVIEKLKTRARQAVRWVETEDRHHLPEIRGTEMKAKVCLRQEDSLPSSVPAVAGSSDGPPWPCSLHSWGPWLAACSHCWHDRPDSRFYAAQLSGETPNLYSHDSESLNVPSFSQHLKISLKTCTSLIVHL
jgi:hypothetical protein